MKRLAFLLCLASHTMYGSLIIGPEGGFTLGYHTLKGYSFQGYTIGGLLGYQFSLLRFNPSVSIDLQTLINYRYQDIVGLSGSVTSMAGHFSYNYEFYPHFTTHKLGLMINPLLTLSLSEGFGFLAGCGLNPSFRMITTYSMNPSVSSNTIAANPFALSVTPLLGMNIRFSKSFGIMILGGYEFEVLSIFPDYDLFMNNIWASLLLVIGDF